MSAELSKSFVFEGMLEGINDIELTPMITVDTKVEGFVGPTYMADDEGILVLNISSMATNGTIELHENLDITFGCKIKGNHEAVTIPIESLLNVFARETPSLFHTWQSYAININDALEAVSSGISGTGGDPDVNNGAAIGFRGWAPKLVNSKGETK